jgi:hypothetical protein
MRIIPRAAGLALVLLGVSCAQDAIFHKAALMGASDAKTAPVDLVTSNTGVTVQSKDNKPSVILDIPFGSVNNLGYAFVDQGKALLFPVMGFAAFFTKGQSHWLVIETSTGAEKGTTVVRLHKSEYHGVIAALTAKSGKRVEMLAPGSTLVDPTIGSHDEDQIVPFPIDQVRTALKPATEHCFCKVNKSKAGRVECAPRRSLCSGRALQRHSPTWAITRS